jgi:hypothetical protein
MCKAIIKLPDILHKLYRGVFYSYYIEFKKAFFYFTTDKKTGTAFAIPVFINYSDFLIKQMINQGEA